MRCPRCGLVHKIKLEKITQWPFGCHCGWTWASADDKIGYSRFTRGLGDVIQHWLLRTGIAALLYKYKIIDPATCGCAKRIERLNNAPRSLLGLLRYMAYWLHPR